MRWIKRPHQPTALEEERCFVALEKATNLDEVLEAVWKYGAYITVRRAAAELILAGTLRFP